MCCDSGRDERCTHHDDVGVFWHGLGKVERSPERVTSFKCRDDALQLRAQTEAAERLFIRCHRVLCPASILEEGVLGADTRVIQTGTDRVRLEDLADLGLEKVGTNAVQDTRSTLGQRRRVAVGVNACK